MQETSANNKRIVKNTAFLYFRMLFLMFITFFTSRVVLDKLGIEDYGIQNVVGGLTSMFTFFRSSLSNATQRYLNIALSVNDEEGARKIFCQHQTLYACITVVVVIIAEIVGLWLLKHELVIPAERATAAFWVFQFTVVSLSVTLLTTVYDSVLIAHEQMKVYSYVGVFEGVMKLAIAYIISVIVFDRLIVYSFLLLMISVGVMTYYVYYCTRYYQETRFQLMLDRKSVRETFSFISWNVVGTAVWAINDQGINILLNVFFGPVVNAARGIAFQVSQALNHFSTNFYTAVRPQITKTYAKGDYEYLFSLMFMSSKYSVFLLWYLSLPVILCIDTILRLWLKEVPEYTNDFTIWVLLYTLVNSLNNPIWSLALSIGKLKWYIIIGSGVFLMSFPLSIIALYAGYSPVSVFIIAMIVRSVYIVVVLIIVRNYISISFSDYFNRVIVPSFAVVAASGLFAWSLRGFIPDSFVGVVGTALCTTIFISISLWLFGIDGEERSYFKSYIHNKFFHEEKDNKR